MIRKVDAVSHKRSIYERRRTALHIYGNLGIGRLFQKHDLALNDALALQPDFFGGVAVNDHRARVNARFQYRQHRAGKLGNGLAEERPLRYLFGRAGVL